jgi:hypothetical protein
MVKHGFVFTDPEALKLADKFGWTVAHEMAKDKVGRVRCVFEDPEILTMRTHKGETVLHQAIVTLARFFAGIYGKADTVIVVDPSNRVFTRKKVADLLSYFFSKPEFYALADNDGWTVAHAAISGIGKHHAYYELEIERDFKHVNVWSVALSMSLDGFLKLRERVRKLVDAFYTPEALKLADNEGLTVAHVAAACGCVFENEEILNLKEPEQGMTVRDVIEKVYEHFKNLSEVEVIKKVDEKVKRSHAKFRKKTLKI